MVSFFYIWSKTDRSEVQNGSKEGYLTLWCHQPHPGQSLNPLTVVEFGGQEMESGWIFQRVLSLVVQKQSCKLDYQDKVLVLKHSSLTVSCVCFSKTSLVLSHSGWLQEKYEKLQEQFVSLGDGWDPVSLECRLKLLHIQYNHSPIYLLQGLDKDRVVFRSAPQSVWPTTFKISGVLRQFVLR